MGRGRPRIRSQPSSRFISTILYRYKPKTVLCGLRPKNFPSKLSQFLAVVGYKHTRRSYRRGRHRRFVIHRGGADNLFRAQPPPMSSRLYKSGKNSYVLSVPMSQKPFRACTKCSWLSTGGAVRCFFFHGLLVGLVAGFLADPANCTDTKRGFLATEVT